MQDIYITRIHIGKVRHLENVDIILSDTECKHLILTGKNGSGKTSVLEAVRDKILFHQINNYMVIREEDRKYVSLSRQKESQLELRSEQLSVDYSSPPDYASNTFVYVSAARNKVDVPDAITQILNDGKTIITRNASINFLKYILNLYVQYLSTKDSGGSTEDIERYEIWFGNFTNALREIYSCQYLEIKPDMKNLTFQIVLPGREPFKLNEMSDGYAAFIDIYMELLMRLESADAIVEYDKPAIVLIDEIETHLHVELQKRILPFLTKAFPNIQFIVATHSPFVITSLENAVVYDLEKKETLDKPSLYSFESVVESFLDTSAYSLELRRYFNRYKELCFKVRTADENEEFLIAKTELELMSPASKELYFAFNDLEDKRKMAKNG